MKAFPLICGIFLLLVCGDVCAQLEEEWPSRPVKNVIGLNVGPMHPQATLEYERTLFSGRQRLLSLSAGFSLGYLMLASSSGPQAGLKGILLIGREKHHLELTAGAMWFFDWDGFEYEISTRQGAGDPEKVYWTDYLGLWPVFTLGYRYQKPGGRWMFRAGTGFPVTYAYVGCGIAF